ncbi:MAG: DEAD/DEAH box helicase domain protein [Microgenomates group bacterium GW2011_GWC1_46_16]|uniref:YprB ribonuclease H-like domain-containing protein n=2 Tax=Candidatus Collieribacteriota TaxID=1752725 RepID=A0A1F5FXP3_9BACT|nr:MAG: DEAD/DEAH box helicase domain protein [Microgenomates group bacterium GW2011_GWF1_46_12]KKU27076.1 MAG: DEAD/DEAH box helicase domain protein [Microgenomates group bacterium GW2011_GWC1_46_16]KKU27882.1 MAG: DEAD/DEAH box helicase domain protein [Microgenomates group bacterium GW2011_GWF2_46_18]KKU44284.1 MAG: DEAD/DEAH box helicase domain protein [Microgenomates group bacterium GW2011_GWA1_46_7]KKU44942.1 MAG: DEAD/DEAH box helicase domain protein [Microgenomates group bacterium GW2011
MKLLVFDVETKKAFDEVGGYFPEKLGVSIIGSYFRDEEGNKEEYVGYREDNFSPFWRRLEQADLVVGFNTIAFDYPTLKPYYGGDFSQFPSLDIMVELEKHLGHRVGLDAVAKETLGMQKSGHGLDAITYYHEGEWEKLEKYCLQDVKVTKELYDYGVKNKILRFKNKWNNLIEVPVDFEKQRKTKVQVQTTLF